MGATPPIPLTKVSKAHFRSAAVGGAPHFVRRKSGVATFLFARKLLSQFPSPMGATPPIPLTKMGKAHFRSAAVGGAPHFVRRKSGVATFY